VLLASARGVDRPKLIERRLEDCGEVIGEVGRELLAEEQGERDEPSPGKRVFRTPFTEPLFSSVPRGSMGPKSCFAGA